MLIGIAFFFKRITIFINGNYNVFFFGGNVSYINPAN